MHGTPTRSLFAPPRETSDLCQGQAIHAEGWRGVLELEFESSANSTFLRRQRHLGPLRVQRPFVENSGTCQVYVLHPPGGVVGGDELQIHATLRPNAQALLTSPGATKFYRSPGKSGAQLQNFRVETGACLEWLPQEAIVFNGSNAKNTTRVELACGASFAGWEITSLGRPACKERFLSGNWQQRFEIHREGRPVWLERSRFDGGGQVLDAPWGLGSHPVFGSFVVVPKQPLAEDHLSQVKQLAQVASHAEDVATDINNQLSATQFEEAIVCRYLGNSTHQARDLFAQIWSILRPSVFSKAAEAPRIWAT